MSSWLLLLKSNFSNLNRSSWAWSLSFLRLPLVGSLFSLVDEQEEVVVCMFLEVLHLQECLSAQVL
jgi:hypothetical protein